MCHKRCSEVNFDWKSEIKSSLESHGYERQKKLMINSYQYFVNMKVSLDAFLHTLDMHLGFFFFVTSYWSGKVGANLSEWECTNT